MNRTIIIAALGSACLFGGVITPSADAAATQQTQARRDEVRVIARARGEQGIAKGDFRQRGRQSRLNVEVQHGQPGEVLSVSVDGQFIGTMTVNGFGRGKIELNTKDGQRVPTVTAGSVLEVGDMSGTFTRRN